MKRMFSLAAAALLSATFANASVTILTGATGVMRDSGGAMVPLGSIGILVADLDNDNLINPFGTTLTVGNTLDNAGSDLILGVYQAVDLDSGQVGFKLDLTQFTYSGNFSTGDNLWLLWFPSVSTTGSTVSAGISYGAFRSDLLDARSTMAWVAPADGTDQDLFSLDTALGGSPAVSPAQFSASFTTVPEPSTYGLLGVALFGAIFLKRRGWFRPRLG